VDEGERDRQRDSVLRSASKTGAAVVQLMRPAVESPASELVVCTCMCVLKER